MRPVYERIERCAIAIETIVSGAYAGTYNAVPLGFTENGWEIQHDTKAEEISNTDLYGDSIIDIVHRGGNCYAMGDCKVYKSGTITPFYPWGPLGQLFSAAAPIGRLGSGVAAALVLTAIANTPAAAPSITSTVTASKAILAPNSNLRLLFTSKCRNVPQRLLLLPSESGGTGTWFTTT